jgi:hypothetical protein
VTSHLPPFPLRTECPPGACICARDRLLADPQGDLRDLADLRHLEERMEQQLGIRLTLVTSPRGVRSLRGILIRVQEQPGLCRKTRQAIPAAIRRGIEKRPQIAWEIANAGGLFEAP